jgi:hypothetical protein
VKYVFQTDTEDSSDVDYDPKKDSKTRSMDRKAAKSKASSAGSRMSSGAGKLSKPKTATSAGPVKTCHTYRTTIDASITSSTPVRTSRTLSSATVTTAVVQTVSISIALTVTHSLLNDE